jgi:predicted TIM-barrel fold metal-dependent hydrolase
MIVDSHIHYTQPDTLERPHAHPPIGVDPVSYDELIGQARQAGVDRIVQVTASCMGNDNRYAFEGAAARTDVVVGVVGRFDAFAPELRGRLEDFWRQPHALGVRFTLHHDWAVRWLRDGTLAPFFAEAQRLNIPVFLYAPNQIDELRATARRYPGLRIVVDHTAIRYEPRLTPAQVFARWREVIALAQEPNVWMKVSYFPEAAADSEPYPWPTSRQRFREMYDAVGAARMVWGSNVPPLMRVCSWRQALDFIKVECDFLDAVDRAAILGGNFMQDFAR